MSENIKKTVGIYTLGCKVNQYESEALSEKIASLGYTISDFDGDNFAYVINSCTVTAESDRKARQLIRRAINRSPSAYILVCGCYAQNSPHSVADIRGVDYICGTSNKMSIADKIAMLDAQGHKNTQTEICVPPLSNAGFEHMRIKKFDRTRAYIKIQDGCESHCAYCAIPSARGPVRSKPFADIIEEVTYLTQSGCREIVLTGIETGDYGRDIGGTDLASLLVAVDKIPDIGRVRLGSLDPAIIKPAFLDKIRDLRSLAHHFHISLQSGSSNVLAKMKRKYNADQAMNAIRLLRDTFPDVQLTTDVIVGFPCESNDDFEMTKNFAKEARFLMIHVFPYSKRAGTPAAKMDGQVDGLVKRSRAAELSALEASIRKDILDGLYGSVSEVLFESYHEGFAYGHTPEFVEIRVRSEYDRHGEEAVVIIGSNDGNICEAEICDKNI